MAGLLAIAYERRLARRELETRRAMQDLEAARNALFQTIAQGLDDRLSAQSQQVQRLFQNPGIVSSNGNELRILQYNTQRLQRFTADIRDVIALGAGKLPLEKAPVDLRDLVQAAVDQNAAMSRHYNVELKVHCEASLPVLADAARLSQVVNDLLRNGFNFTAPGGAIHVIGGVQEQSARITVQDNGRGLTEDEKNQLFRPFTKAHRPGESREVGTGLGLFIAKGIIESHGGRIWAESEGRGKGSRFVFEVPLHARPFDIRNAPKLPSGAPQLPPAMAKAEKDAVR